MKKYAISLAMLTVCGSCALADTPAEMTRPDLGDENPSQSVIPANPPKDVVGTDGSANWYVNMSYGGFDFELPAGTIVERGSSLLAKYPDGSFGVSMTNEGNRAANQKIAFELCRKMAASMHLPDPRVEKVSFGKCGGAKATGRLEGQEVTILVLPYDSQQTTTVILATPHRSDWVDHFLQTLKR